MWTIFALENLNFALNVFASLTLLAVSWLYFDAYRELKSKKELWKVLGFVVLAVSFLFRAMNIEGMPASGIVGYQDVFKSLDIISRISGYLFLIVALFVDPLQPKPKLNAVFVLSISSLIFLSPILSSIVAILYFRRATVGLERHIYPPSIGFFILSIYELIYSLTAFQHTDNLFLFNILSAFNIVWFLRLLFLSLAIVFFGRWVFRYLLKQFQSQLFMIQMALVLSIYLIVTVGFTGLLINNLKNQILNELKSEALVLDFAFNAKREELLQTAKQIAKNVKDFDFATNKNDSLIVLNKDGIVTYRAEDQERKGDSMSGESLVKQVLKGVESSDIVVKDGVVSPTVMIVSASPIIKDGVIDGGVLVGEIIDNSYIEGFSKKTGLRAAIYGSNILAAGGILGVKETNAAVKELVLSKSEVYSAETRWLNKPFLSVYAPLVNVDGNPVGMYFVGRPQSEVLTLASKTLETVFLGTIILLFLSMIPAKMIASSISKQIK